MRNVKKHGICSAFFEFCIYGLGNHIAACEILLIVIFFHKRVAGSIKQYCAFSP